MADLCDCEGQGAPSVIDFLRRRFEHGEVYLNCGRILIALNPYRRVDALYAAARVDAAHGSHCPEREEPHVFVVGELMYRAPVERRRSQAVLSSGDSGAVKTESARLLLQYLRTVSHSDSVLEECIYAAGPLTASSWCARTVRNDISSRFGKFLSLHFGESGRIAGATLSTYLLEKSRVTHFGPDECGYHAFYALAGAARGEHAYLRQGAAPPPAHDMAQLREAFGRIGMDDRACDEVWGVVSGILLLGNVALEHADHEMCRISSDTARCEAALGLSCGGLREVLEHRTIRAGAEVVRRAHTRESARDARDALARELYARLFDAIIEAANACIRPAEACARSIGVVDIFGFEAFAVNSLEQLCINFANEKLQTLFMRVVVSDTLEAYRAEGIAADKVDYRESTAIDDLFERKASGLWAALDEECSVPRGSDAAFGEKLLRVHTQSAVLRRSKGMSAREGFLVKHFAGPVEYTLAGWLEKNRNALPADMAALAQASAHPLVGRFFAAPPAAAVPSARARRSVATLTGVFCGQLRRLDDLLRVGDLHFVRCIKPNDRKASGAWDAAVVERQITASGMLVALQVMKTGYPERMAHKEFAGTFACVPDAPPPRTAMARERCAAILAGGGLAKRDYAIGKSKVFLTSAALTSLRARRHARLGAVAIRLQAHARRAIARRVLEVRRVDRRRALAVLTELTQAGDATAEKLQDAILSAERTGACRGADSKALLKRAKARAAKLKRGGAKHAAAAAVAVDEADDAAARELERELIDAVCAEARRKNVRTIAPLEAVVEYATLIGVDAEIVDLLWIADEALRSGFPDGWETRHAANSEPFYVETATGAVAWQHPIDHQCVARHAAEVERLQSERTQTAEGVRLLTRDLFGTTSESLAEILIEPVPKLVRCYVLRHRFRGRYDFFLQVGASRGVYCMSARRRAMRACHYDISIEGDSGHATVGLGTLVDADGNGDLALFDARARAKGTQRLAFTAKPTPLNPRGVCALLASSPVAHLGWDAPGDARVLVPIEPVYNKRTRRAELSFGGRATIASTKNLQLRARDATKMSFLLGKTSNARFSVDLSPPLSPVTAFALALAVFEEAVPR